MSDRPKIKLSVISEDDEGADCSNILVISQSENEGAEWLLNVLDDIVAKNGTNAEIARNALIFIGKLIDHNSALHEKLDLVESLMGKIGGKVSGNSDPSPEKN